jgi:hypothetical protein
VNVKEHDGDRGNVTTFQRENSTRSNMKRYVRIFFLPYSNSTAPATEFTSHVIQAKGTQLRNTSQRTIAECIRKHQNSSTTTHRKTSRADIRSWAPHRSVIHVLSTHRRSIILRRRSAVAGRTRPIRPGSAARVACGRWGTVSSPSVCWGTVRWGTIKVLVLVGLLTVVFAAVAVRPIGWRRVVGGRGILWGDNSSSKKNDGEEGD